MIKGISGTFVPALGDVEKKLSKKETKQENYNLNYNYNLTRPSLSHLKANYLTFKGEKSAQNLPAKIEKESQNHFDPLTSNMNDLTTKQNLKMVSWYSKQAKQAALMLAAGKHVKLDYKEGAKPEIFAETFTQMLRSGAFVNAGFDFGNTDVTYLNANNMLSMGSNPLEPIVKLSNKKLMEKRKQILFIDNMDKFIENMNSSGVFMNSRLTDEILIVGLMPEKKPSNSPIGIIGNDDNSWEKRFKTMKLNTPSPDAAKRMLKNPKLLGAYLLESVNITPDAIDESVDGTMSIAGEYPGKAFDLLNLAIKQKAMDTRQKVSLITSDDVKAVYQKNPEFKEKIMSSLGKFEVIYNPTTKLSDVGGIKNIKKEIEEDLLSIIKNPDKYKQAHADMPKGVLLDGPPGTGKTLLAKAIAGEAGVPFIAAAGSEFIEKYVGVGAQRVRDLFDLAKAEARKNEKKTAIVFIDEIDSVGGKRGVGNGEGHSEQEQTLNQILTEMNGLKDDSDVNIVVIAATNRPDMLDDALTRAGRFDMKFTVPNPAGNKAARLEILQIHAKNKPFKNEAEKQEILAEMAESTDGCSGADLAEIVKKAVRLTMKPNRTNPFITLDDMQEAKLQLRYGAINELDSTSFDKENTVAHEVGHITTLYVMEQAAKEIWEKPYYGIDMVTLQPRGKFLGALLLKPNRENEEKNLPSVIADLVCSYGGYNIENIRKGTNGAGVRQDLNQATQLAKTAITQWGLGPNTGVISAKDDPFIEKIKEKEIAKDIDLLTRTANIISAKILNFHKEFVDEYVQNYRKSSENGQGGSTLSAKDFQKLYNEWITKNNKEKDLQALYADIRKSIEAITAKIDQAESEAA